MLLCTGRPALRVHPWRGRPQARRWPGLPSSHNLRHVHGGTLSLSCRGTPWKQVCRLPCTRLLEVHAVVRQAAAPTLQRRSRNGSSTERRSQHVNTNMVETQEDPAPTLPSQLTCGSSEHGSGARRTAVVHRVHAGCLRHRTPQHERRRGRLSQPYMQDTAPAGCHGVSYRQRGWSSNVVPDLDTWAMRGALHT